MASASDPSSVRLRLYQGEAHPCAYLPARSAIDQFSVLDHLAPADYQILMNNGFRRSGRIVYRPRCIECSECVPIRVAVKNFAPTRSQRRVIRKNADVELEISPPSPTEEQWRIYQAYVGHQHQPQTKGNRESFKRFLYDSPTDTIEMTYRIDGRIAGVGIVDVDGHLTYEYDAENRLIAVL